MSGSIPSIHKETRYGLEVAPEAFQLARQRLGGKRDGARGGTEGVTQRPDPGGELEVATESVGELDLAGGAALGLEQARVGDQDAGAGGARGRDVEAVQAEQELHAVGDVFRRGRSHRVDHDRRFLALELVDGPDMHVSRPAQLKRMLDGVQVARRGAQRGGSLIVVELFQVPDGVAFHAGAQQMPGDRVEIDEQACPQHPVDLVLTGGVTPHPLPSTANAGSGQAFDRPRFVGREVKDMEVGMALPALQHLVDEGFECSTLLRAVQGCVEIPATRERWSSARRRRSQEDHQRQMSHCGTGSG